AHQDRVRVLRDKLDAAGIPHMHNPSHIVPVVVGDAAKCRAVSNRLLDGFDIYIQPINYPTVPRGTERLRITPSPLHTYDDIDCLVDALDAVWSEHHLARTRPIGPTMPRWRIASRQPLPDPALCPGCRKVMALMPATVAEEAAVNEMHS
ncbi:MAG: aminotransferase class I/II-fold pyridoxal phosphate-dependent enzyme, partial [Ensifer adhaerens]